MKMARNRLVPKDKERACDCCKINIAMVMGNQKFCSNCRLCRSKLQIEVSYLKRQMRALQLNR